MSWPHSSLSNSEYFKLGGKFFLPMVLLYLIFNSCWMKQTTRISVSRMLLDSERKKYILQVGAVVLLCGLDFLRKWGWKSNELFAS